MTIPPFVPGAYRSSVNAASLRDTRNSLDDLQRQLVTGKKSVSYGGLGADRITSLSLRARSSEIEGFKTTIVSFQNRARLLDLGLDQLGKMSGELRSSTFLPQFNPDSTGKTSMQRYARARLDEAVDVLNTEINGQRIYGGRSPETRPVVDVETILNGDSAGRAGVRQLIVERKAADFGTGTGRLNLGGAGAVATLQEDGAHPFGFKLTAASSTSPGVTAALTAGPPADIAFTVTALPAPGEELRFELTMPDGSTKAVSLAARAAPLTPPSNAGEFEIGGTTAATALNIRNAIAAAVTQEAATALPEASAKTAADAFFAGSINSPPLRVVGPPAIATALAAGTAADTVIWYQGDDTAPDPRATVSARIDSSISVGVGVQANEEGVQRLLSNLAVFVTESFANTPADQGRYQAMSDRLRADLGQTSGVQTVQQIQLEIGLAANLMQTADERHRTKLALVTDTISGIEDASQEETAAKLLTLQTKMQASYQTTSILSRLSLTDYLR